MKKIFFLSLVLVFLGLNGLFAQVGEGEQDVYLGIILFDKETHFPTGNRPLLLNAQGKENLTEFIHREYVLSEEPGTALYYAVHEALANLTANASEYPDNLKTVNIITFTDGIDVSSTNPLLPEVEGKSFVQEGLPAYQKFLQNEISNRKINGISINAYALGYEAKDVNDPRMFEASINALASNGQGEVVDSMMRVRQKLEEIADEMYSLNRDTTFNLLTTPLPLRTKIRMTFDLSDGSRDATRSQKYLEGEVVAYDNSTRRYQLRITNRQGVSFTSPNIMYGDLTQDGVTYTFSDFQGFDFEKNSSSFIKQWIMNEGSTIWQLNSEFTPEKFTNTQENWYSTVIYLVLDKSSSMEDNIKVIKEAALGVIDRFAPASVSSQSSPPPRTPAPPPPPRPSVSGAEHYLYLDTAPLIAGAIDEGFGIGFGYEMAVANHFSIDFYASTLFATHELDVAADVLFRLRWYPLDYAVEKLFLGAAIGYGFEMRSSTKDYYDPGYYHGYEDETYVEGVFSVGGMAGWKFVFGSFGLEPWIGYTFPRGLQIGVSLGVAW